MVTGTRTYSSTEWIVGFQSVNVNCSCPSISRHWLMFDSWQRNWGVAGGLWPGFVNSLEYASLITF